MSGELQDDLMMQAVRLYYLENMTQEEIGKRLYVSRTKVSRLLKAAKKFVHIQIDGQSRRNTLLEEAFERCFDLEKAVILSALPEDETKIFQAVAEEAASYVDTLLDENSVIGISRGQTMQAIVNSLKPKKKLPIHVVQLIGLMNNPSQNSEEMELVRSFANAYGGSYHNLFSPFVLDDEETRKILNRVSGIDKTLELAQQADIILTSIGSFCLEDKNILWNSYLTPEEKQTLVDKGAMGLFCGHLFDQEGKILEDDIHQRIVGLTAEQIICNKKHVVGVSTGRKKVLPTLGALRGKLIKTLITDEYTALNILIAEGKQVF